MATAVEQNGSASNSPVVCVFCGASAGKSPEHLEAARSLAHAFHKNGIKLVYGGGNIGLMGEVARTLVELSGPDAVHGIIPQALLEFERGSDNGAGKGIPDQKTFGRTTVVQNMHARKQLMAQEVIAGGPGSGFVVLSGGFGTLEEAMENATWNQLGIHAQPIVMFNVGGYWDGIMQWLNNAVESGFISESNKRILAEARTSDEVLHQLRNYELSNGRFNLKWDKV